MKKVISLLLVMVMCLSISGNGCFGTSVNDGAVCVTEASSIGICDGKFVIISESATIPLSLKGSSISVDGGLFSNFSIISTGGDKYITPEECELYTYDFIQKVFDNSGEFTYGVEAYVKGNKNVSVNDYSEKSMSVSGNTVQCENLAGAANNVNISANTISNLDPDNATRIISLNGNIELNADKIDLVGLIYAPNGAVRISANMLDFKGIIVANEVSINAANMNLVAQDLGFDIEMYLIDEDDAFYGDIMSALGTSGDSEYYYNTGGNYVEGAKYTKYRLLEKVKVGDVVYERKGSWYVSGHIAFVDAIKTFYVVNHSTGQSRVQKYIVLIEAVGEGVCYGLLDDKRLEDRKGKVLRYRFGLTSNELKAIRYFLERQLGKPWLYLPYSRDTDINTKRWYCSELVWAAFMWAGIDIEGSGVDGAGSGVMPRDILRASCMMTVVDEP